MKQKYLLLNERNQVKEISCIHVEGYPAVEMKHAPSALMDEHMPVLCLA